MVPFFTVLGALGGLFGTLGATLGRVLGLWGLTLVSLGWLRAGLSAPRGAGRSQKCVTPMMVRPLGTTLGVQICFFALFQGPTSLEATVCHFRGVRRRKRGKGCLEWEGVGGGP